MIRSGLKPPRLKIMKKLYPSKHRARNILANLAIWKREISIRL